MCQKGLACDMVKAYFTLVDTSGCARKYFSSFLTGSSASVIFLAGMLAPLLLFFPIVLSIMLCKGRGEEKKYRKFPKKGMRNESESRKPLVYFRKKGTFY